jgi:hypothetical protein
MNVGPINHEPSLRMNLDGPPERISQIEKTAGVLPDAIAADPNENLRNGIVEPRPGLEHADHAAKMLICKAVLDIDIAGNAHYLE